MRCMLATWAVAFFTANVPFRHCLFLNVVVDRMASIAQGTRRALHIVRRVERSPPVGPVSYEIRSPDLVRDIPLRREDEIIIIDFLEVALLPLASVNEGNIVLFESHERVGL